MQSPTSQIRNGLSNADAYNFTRLSPKRASPGIHEIVSKDVGYYKKHPEGFGLENLLRARG